MNASENIIAGITKIATDAAELAVVSFLDSADAKNMAELTSRVMDLNTTSNALVEKVEAITTTVKCLEDESDMDALMKQAIDGFELINQETLDDAVRDMERNIERMGDDLPSSEMYDDLNEKVDDKADQEEVDTLSRTMDEHEEQLTKNSQKVVDLELVIQNQDKVIMDLVNKVGEGNETRLACVEKILLSQTLRLTKLEQDNELLKKALSEARAALLTFTITA